MFVFGFLYRHRLGANSLRDDGGVPRKTAGFVGCRWGRHPLRSANSHGCSIIVGDDIPIVPLIIVFVFCSAKNFRNSSFPGFPAKPQVLWGGFLIPGVPRKRYAFMGWVPHSSFYLTFYIIRCIINCYYFLRT